MHPNPFLIVKSTRCIKSLQISCFRTHNGFICGTGFTLFLVAFSDCRRFHPKHIPQTLNPKTYSEFGTLAKNKKFNCFVGVIVSKKTKSCFPVPLRSTKTIPKQPWLPSGPRVLSSCSAHLSPLQWASSAGCPTKFLPTYLARPKPACRMCPTVVFPSYPASLGFRVN